MKKGSHSSDAATTSRTETGSSASASGVGPFILDGKGVAAKIQNEIQERVRLLSHSAGVIPGLGVILVGDNPASHAYVANKEKFAKKCGFHTVERRLAASASQREVGDVIDDYNRDPKIHGILLQLPLPKGLDANALLDRIDPKKDADGLHPLNQGLLQRGDAVLRPCTPLGVLKLLDIALAKSDFSGSILELPRADLSGKRAIVVGRSILVGKPVGSLLLERNATVTMAHSKSPDLPSLVGEADIVVAAVGVPKMIQGAWIKEGAIVLDVGINRMPSGELVGDVDYETAKPRSSAITPVPKGVGPMTVAMLMLNTLLSCEHAATESSR